MKNMGLRDDILESLLPTKWSRWIAALSIASGTASFFLPEFLKLVCIKISECTALLLRISTPLFLWLLGSLIVLAIVVQYSKVLKVQKQAPLPISTPVAKPSKLPKEQTHILLLLFKQGELLTFQIAQSLNMLEDIAKYHLKKLTKEDFVREINLPGIGPPGQSSWFITDNGKKYLIENRLIS
jgi:hypothetical protein